MNELILSRGICLRRWHILAKRTKNEKDGLHFWQDKDK
jgi:hypothetical protein